MATVDETNAALGRRSEAENAAIAKIAELRQQLKDAQAGGAILDEVVAQSDAGTKALNDAVAAT